METKGMTFDQNNKENKRNENNINKEKRNKHLIISNQISRLMFDNQNLKKELEKEKNTKKIGEKNEENLNETHNKIVHQQIDNMKWGYIQQIKEFEKKILQLNMEKDELLLIVQELDRLAKKQKEIISKNEKKFINLKKYSMYFLEKNVFLKEFLGIKKRFLMKWHKKRNFLNFWNAIQEFLKKFKF